MISGKSEYHQFFLGQSKIGTRNYAAARKNVQDRIESGPFLGEFWKPLKYIATSAVLQPIGSKLLTWFDREGDWNVPVQIPEALLCDAPIRQRSLWVNTSTGHGLEQLVMRRFSRSMESNLWLLRKQFKKSKEERKREASEVWWWSN